MITSGETKDTLYPIEVSQETLNKGSKDLEYDNYYGYSNPSSIFLVDKDRSFQDIFSSKSKGEEFYKFFHLQEDPSQAGLFTAIVKSQDTSLKRRDKEKVEFIYGRQKIDGEDTIFFGKILNVNKNSILWSPYISSKISEELDFEESNLWEDKRTIVCVSHKDGTQVYDPMLRNESIKQSLNILDVREEKIPREITENIVGQIYKENVDTYRRRKEIFTPSVIRNAGGEYMSFPLVSLFNAILEPSNIDSNPMEIKLDETKEGIESLPTEYINLLNKDSLLAVGYNTGISSSIGEDININDEDAKEYIKNTGQPEDSNLRSTNFEDKCFVETSVPFIGRPVIYNMKNNGEEEETTIGRTIVSIPLILSCPSVYTLKKDSPAYIKNEYIHLPNCGHRLKFIFSKKHIGKIDERNIYSILKQYGEDGKNYQEVIDSLEKIPMTEGKAGSIGENITLTIEFPSVKQVLYNEICMLGSEESLDMEYSEDYYMKSGSNEGNPIFRVPSISQKVESTSNRSNIATKIGDDTNPKIDGLLVVQKSLYGSLFFDQIFNDIFNTFYKPKRASVKDEQYIKVKLLHKGSEIIIENSREYIFGTEKENDRVRFMNEPIVSFKHNGELSNNGEFFFSNKTKEGEEKEYRLSDCLMEYEINLDNILEASNSRKKDRDDILDSITNINKLLSSICSLEIDSRFGRKKDSPENIVARLNNKKRSDEERIIVSVENKSNESVSGDIGNLLAADGIDFAKALLCEYFSLCNLYSLDKNLISKLKTKTIGEDLKTIGRSVEKFANQNIYEEGDRNFYPELVGLSNDERHSSIFAWNYQMKSRGYVSLYMMQTLREEPKKYIYNEVIHILNGEVKIPEEKQPEGTKVVQQQEVTQEGTQVVQQGGQEEEEEEEEEEEATQEGGEGAQGEEEKKGETQVGGEEEEEEEAIQEEGEEAQGETQAGGGEEEKAQEQGVVEQQEQGQGEVKQQKKQEAQEGGGEGSQLLGDVTQQYGEGETTILYDDPSVVTTEPQGEEKTTSQSGTGATPGSPIKGGPLNVDTGTQDPFTPKKKSAPQGQGESKSATLADLLSQSYSSYFEDLENQKGDTETLGTVETGGGTAETTGTTGTGTVVTTGTGTSTTTEAGTTTTTGTGTTTTTGTGTIEAGTTGTGKSTTTEAGTTATTGSVTTSTTGTGSSEAGTTGSGTAGTTGTTGASTSTGSSTSSGTTELSFTRPLDPRKWDLYTKTGYYKQGGIVSETIIIEGKTGIPCIEHGGPFVGSMKELNQRARFEKGIGKGSYPYILSISFYTYEELLKREVPKRVIGASEPYVERIVDVGNEKYSVRESMNVIGAQLNSKNGKMIDSSAKAKSFGGQFVSEGMQKIPLSGVIIIAGQKDEGDTLFITLDYSFLVSNKYPLGSLQRRIFSLHVKDDKGRKRQLAMVHMKAFRNKGEDTMSVDYIMFGLNKEYKIIEDHSMEILKRIANYLKGGSGTGGTVGGFSGGTLVKGGTTLGGGSSGSGGSTLSGGTEEDVTSKNIKKLLRDVLSYKNTKPSPALFNSLLEQAKILSIRIDDLKKILPSVFKAIDNSNIDKEIKEVERKYDETFSGDVYNRIVAFKKYIGDILDQYNSAKKNAISSNPEVAKGIKFNDIVFDDNISKNYQSQKLIKILVFDSIDRIMGSLDPRDHDLEKEEIITNRGKKYENINTKLRDNYGYKEVKGEGGRINYFYYNKDFYSVPLLLLPQKYLGEYIPIRESFDPNNNFYNYAILVSKDDEEDYLIVRLKPRLGTSPINYKPIDNLITTSSKAGNRKAKSLFTDVLIKLKEEGKIDSIKFDDAKGEVYIRMVDNEGEFYQIRGLGLYYDPYSVLFFSDGEKAFEFIDNIENILKEEEKKHMEEKSKSGGV